MKATGFKPVGRVKIMPSDPVVTWVSTTLADANDANAYTATLQATCGNTAIPVSYSVVSGALPTGILLSSQTGSFTGTAGVSGVFNFTVRATAGRGFADREFTLNVVALGYDWSSAVLRNSISGAASSYMGGGSASLDGLATTALFGKVGGGTSLPVYLFNTGTGLWAAGGSLSALDSSYHMSKLSRDGLTAVVGSPAVSSSAGTIYIYDRPSTASTTWTKRQTIAGPGAPNNFFGQNLAISDDGSRVATVGVSQNLVFVYTKTAGNWGTYEGKSAAMNTAGGTVVFNGAISNPYMMMHMSGDGSKIVVGAPVSATNVGCVQVFELESGTWTFKQRWSRVGSNYYGLQTRLSKDGLMAFNMIANPNTGNPSVEVYRRVSGTWGTTPYASIIVPAMNLASNGVKWMDVDDTGDTIALGFGDPSVQKVFVLKRSKITPTSWSEVKQFNQASEYGFPTSLAISGDGTAIAAGSANYGSGAGRGHFYGK